jgi:hypothetical protein
MKTGRTVRYVTGKSVSEARVAAVVGSGESGYKRLDLTVDGKLLKDVAHESDASGAFWSLESEAELGKRLKASKASSAKAKK